MPLLRLFYDLTTNKAGRAAPVEYLLSSQGEKHIEPSNNASQAIQNSVSDVDQDNNFKRPVAIVTGSNVGIGLETARGLWLRGYIVIMACRSLERAEDARKTILSLWEKNKTMDQESLSATNLIVMKLDLGDLDSVKDFSKEYKSRFNYVTAIVTNAGILSPIGKETKQGFEMTYGVCYLAHQLLIELMIPLMKKQECGLTPRIVILSSVMHKKNQTDFNKIYFKERMRISTWPEKLGRGIPATSSQYSFVKLLNVMQMKILHERLSDRGILVHAVHPGIVKSDISRDYTNGFIRWIMSCIFLTPEQGAQTSIHCASAQSIEEESLSGLYWTNCKVDSTVHPFCNDSAMKRILQNETLDQLKDYLLEIEE